MTEHFVNTQQEPRRLQTDEEVEFDCETKLEILLGFNLDLHWGCTCGEDGKLTFECEGFQSTTRSRCFGGASQCSGGTSRSIDFEQRSLYDCTKERSTIKSRCSGRASQSTIGCEHKSLYYTKD
jgi:hypothetical protein